MKRKPKRAQLSAKTAATRTSRDRTPGVKGSRTKSSGDKVSAYRERMPRPGMKRIEIWVPDPKSPYFAAEARRQAQMIAESSYEKEDQAFIDAVSEWKPD